MNTPYRAALPVKPMSVIGRLIDSCDTRLRHCQSQVALVDGLAVARKVIDKVVGVNFVTVMPAVDTLVTVLCQ